MVNTEIRLIIFFVAEDQEALNIWQKQDWELIMPQMMSSLFSLNLKKVGKTTKPLRKGLNQILCDYTVKVTNRFKGLALLQCLRNYG